MNIEMNLEKAISMIRNSLLFDENYYVNKYNIKDIDPAEHYLLEGYKKRYNPSQIFNNIEYYNSVPAIKNSDVNPLLHYELIGRREGVLSNKFSLDKLREMHPELLSDMQDGILRVRITNACNAKCRYCGVRVYFSEDEKKQSMDKNWLFEMLKPIYSKVKIALLTGGDPLIMPHSYEYIKFLSEEYPHITTVIESNGILFNNKFQNLALKHLIKVHVSINASNRRIFANSCWEGTGGEKIHDAVLANLHTYITLLKQNDMLCFAPDYSMVINHDNFPDVVNFAKLALSLNATFINYFFDYTENNMGGEYFADPQFSRPALKAMMELERVLADKVMVNFRLWIPTKELDMMQNVVDGESTEELHEKYADVLKLAEGRSIIKEFERRNNFREKNNKKLLTFEEDYTLTIHMEKRQGKERCFAPWGELDIYPDGKLDFCGWYQHTININDFIKDGVLDWNEVINSYEYMYERKAILNGDYIKCLPCCPMNDNKNPIVDMFKYSMTNKKNNN